MGFSCGIIGLPNVGKSSLFNAVSGAHAASSNYPFCTIEPNKGTIAVPDNNLTILESLVESKKTTPTVLELVDVAGLVEGAHKGEGLGNQFLAHVRELDAVMHLVRLFKDKEVAREEGLDPVGDLKIIIDELRFKDLETIKGRLEKEVKHARSTKDQGQVSVLNELKEKLESQELVKSESLSDQQEKAAYELALLTTKPCFVVANVDEADLEAPEQAEGFQALKDYLAPEKIPLLAISAKIEEEIHGLDPEEQAMFMGEYKLTSTGLERIIRTGYGILDLITFYTFNKNELRAWTLKKGKDVIDAAGKVHSDMARGFIKADVINIEDFISLGSFSNGRKKGKVTTAGHDYIVRDKDIIFVKFKV